jgi:DNA-binding PadR family transcriptional regulator
MSTDLLRAYDRFDYSQHNQMKSREPDTLLPLKPVVFQVLLSLSEGERHGYAIVQDIAERSSARLRLEPGNLYRHLKFMLDEGLIEESDRRPVPGKDDERRRYYRITRFGRQAALAEVARLEALASDARARLVARTQGRS